MTTAPCIFLSINYKCLYNCIFAVDGLILTIFKIINKPVPTTRPGLRCIQLITLKQHMKTCTPLQSTTTGGDG